MPKISMIMPAYNAEKTCRAAIESVLKQKGKDFELIVIDDGSQDETLHICSEYQNKYDNIRVIHKKNGGVSSARNLGLHLAQGEYVGFIDADDLLEENYMQNILNISNDVDMILFGYCCISKKKALPGWLPQPISDNKSLVKDLLTRGGGLNAPWNKVFKKSLITETNLFNTNKQMGEDLEFVCKFLERATSFKIITKSLYLYNADTENSLTKKMDIVLNSITEDFVVKKELAISWGIEERYIDDSLFQRTEGVLGGGYDYQTFQRALNVLNHNNTFSKLLKTTKPIKMKNHIIRYLLQSRNPILLYRYLCGKNNLKKLLKKIRSKSLSIACYIQ